MATLLTTRNTNWRRSPIWLTRLVTGCTTKKNKIRDYKFQVTVFDEADDDYLRDLFIRLQWGLLLNTGEKLHAATGKMKNFVWNFANQSFITNLGIPERRYARQTLCAQITL